MSLSHCLWRGRGLGPYRTSTPLQFSQNHKFFENIAKLFTCTSGPTPKLTHGTAVGQFLSRKQKEPLQVFFV